MCCVQAAYTHIIFFLVERPPGTIVITPTIVFHVKRHLYTICDHQFFFSKLLDVPCMHPTNRNTLIANHVQFTPLAIGYLFAAFESFLFLSLSCHLCRDSDHLWKIFCFFIISCVRWSWPSLKGFLMITTVFYIASQKTIIEEILA